METDTMFWLSMIGSAIALSLVLVDWYVMHCRYAFSNVPNLVNRIFAFFCLAMLAGNAIMVGRADYHSSLYLSAVVALTEAVFLCTNKEKE